MTPEKAQELLDAATPGEWQYATAPAEGSDETKAEYIAKTSQPERADEPPWVTWAENTTGDGFAYLVTAIAGDGPTSEANARLIAAAPELAQAYIDAAAREQRVRELIYASDDGTKHEHNGHAAHEGEAECPGCWAADILRALDGDA